MFVVIVNDTSFTVIGTSINIIRMSVVVLLAKTIVDHVHVDLAVARICRAVNIAGI